ncbi:Uncharacterised protein [Vibrio cholerae]|nr:Uncharacterised protein [Vibrio cholerae]CSI96042.1 Uncharacterised protein [Vibrio cholerae]
MYSLTQVRIESSINLANMRFSGAVFEQQVEFST